MTDRKKKGIGFMVSGAVFAVAGVVFYSMPITPEWLAPAFGLIALVGNFLGFVIVFPDVEG